VSEPTPLLTVQVYETPDGLLVGGIDMHPHKNARHMPDVFLSRHPEIVERRIECHQNS
jgi:hypothetical protein